MSDENKEPMVDHKKAAEEKTQLSEEALSKVSGGFIKFTFKQVNITQTSLAGHSNATDTSE